MPLELPPTYLLDTHLPLEELHELEDQIPNLTYDITEAKLVIGKVTTKQRAIFELRSRKVWTEEVIPGAPLPPKKEVVVQEVAEDRSAKRRKLGEIASKQPVAVELTSFSEAEAKTESHTESETEGETADETEVSFKDAASHRSPTASRPETPNEVAAGAVAVDEAEIPNTPTPEPEPKAPESAIDWGDTVRVVKLAWFEDCLAAGKLLPFGNNLLYEGRPTERPAGTPTKTFLPSRGTKRKSTPDDILARAKADAPKEAPRPFQKGAYAHPRVEVSHGALTRPTHLLHQSTSEHDSPEKFPPIPDWLHSTYSCQRPTPLNPPNKQFIGLLKKIRTARILEGDEIGVRAYSSSIATIAAYPYTLTSPQELLRLPGCSQKIGALFQEFKETGHVAAADDLDNDPKLKVLNLFYEIWGVGATTAREFYAKGWRDLDDVVEYGWSQLSRVQQIGVKYYDEFQIRIPRAEVQAISSVILFYANKIRPGFQMTVVGGYRRGKQDSGDVDVVLSHPDEEATMGFITDIVDELEKGNWITHTLLLSTANSERGQQPVAWKGEGKTKPGTGFDTLDKALLVWQDPHWPTRYEDLDKDPNAKNPNVHRRVDIIISPWRTVGCAVAGWTSGTTFQRDLRRYVAKVHNLKFDSSGIRSRADGHWVDLESKEGKAPDMLTAEKRVFEGLGLEWRDPEERCTE
jgi:DNA polymerase IV